MPLALAPRKPSHSRGIVVLAALAASFRFLAAPAPAHAGTNHEAVIMLHALSPLISKTACVRTENVPANCAGYDAGVNGLALYPTAYFAYLLVVNGDPILGVGGVKLGLEYAGGSSGAADGAGVEIYTWNVCAAYEFPSTELGAVHAWPNPNSANLIAWDPGTECQQAGSTELGVVATAGFFYLASHEPAVLKVIGRPFDGEAGVADCLGTEYRIQSCPASYRLRTGALGFDQPGLNPACLLLCPVPVTVTTWSGIKTLLR